MDAFASLTPGDPAPWFCQRSYANPSYAFDTAAGRYIVLCFFGSARDPHAQAALAAVRARRDLFDDARASFFGVSLDPGDEAEERVADSYPGHRYFWDFDGTVSRAFGAVSRAPQERPVTSVRRVWYVLDPTLRVMSVIFFAPDRSDVAAVLAYLDGLPPPSAFAGFVLQAPILVLPNVFEPELCRRLIALYEAHGGEDSGFMREVDGKTVAVRDHGHKRRKDYVIEDPGLAAETRRRFLRRVVPEIAKAHQFKATRMERYIVACYAAEDEAHFRAHRDNTTKGTAHRRFAVSVNLNDDFDGGEVGFPEYGSRRFKAPAGGAVVFSCSLLHDVAKVTRGRRYAFLPFLYDEPAAMLRQKNNPHLGDGVGAYSADARHPAAERRNGAAPIVGASGGT